MKIERGTEEEDDQLASQTNTFSLNRGHTINLHVILPNISFDDNLIEPTKFHKVQPSTTAIPIPSCTDRKVLPILLGAGRVMGLNATALLL